MSAGDQWKVKANFLFFIVKVKTDFSFFQLTSVSTQVWALRGGSCYKLGSIEGVVRLDFWWTQFTLSEMILFKKSLGELNLNVLLSGRGRRPCSAFTISPTWQFPSGRRWGLDQKHSDSDSPPECVPMWLASSNNFSGAWSPSAQAWPRFGHLVSHSPAPARTWPSRPAGENNCCCKANWIKIKITQVADNLVLLHSQSEGRSRIYDLQLVAKEPAVEVNIS